MNKNLTDVILNHIQKNDIAYVHQDERILINNQPLVSTQTLPLNQHFWHLDEHEFVPIPATLVTKSLSSVSLATGNKGKLGEYQNMIHEISWQSIDQAAHLSKEVLDGVDEYLPTFTGNALLKSMHVAQQATQSGQWVLADDSGFCLSGVIWDDMPCSVPQASGVFPGVFTKRFAKAIHPKGEIDYAYACQWLLENINLDTPAYFECAIALSKSGALTESWVTHGRVHGRFVAPPAKGENGFGFDPVFQPDGYDKTFSEMTQVQKNQISHRALALEEIKRVFLAVD